MLVYFSKDVKNVLNCIYQFDCPERNKTEKFGVKPFLSNGVREKN
jgi:hypothetical protein